MSGIDDKKLDLILRQWGSERCAEMLPDIYEYYLGNLKDEELHKLEQHLSVCTSCRKAYNSFLVEVNKTATVSVSNKLASRFGLRKDAVDLFDKFTKLVFGLQSPSWLVSAEGTRSVEGKKSEYKVGDEFDLYVKSIRDGYLTLFHWDSENNYSLLYPSYEEDNTFVKAGQAISVRLRAGLPKGEQHVKSILTPVMAIDPLSLDFNSLEDVRNSVNNYFSVVAGLSRDEVAVSDISFAVV